jgi:hypothetical protein
VKVVKSCWEGQCCDKVERVCTNREGSAWRARSKAPVVDHRTAREVVACATAGGELIWSVI